MKWCKLPFFGCRPSDLEWQFDVFSNTTIWKCCACGRYLAWHRKDALLITIPPGDVAKLRLKSV